VHLTFHRLVDIAPFSNASRYLQAERIRQRNSRAEDGYSCLQIGAAFQILWQWQVIKESRATAEIEDIGVLFWIQRCWRYKSNSLEGNAWWQRALLGALNQRTQRKRTTRRVPNEIDRASDARCHCIDAYTQQVPQRA
jgi:hypothetical protein